MSTKVVTVDNTNDGKDAQGGGDANRHSHGLGMLIDATLKVTQVADGGQAKSGGVVVGDVITKVGTTEFYGGGSDSAVVALLTEAKAAGKNIDLEFNGSKPVVVAPAPTPAPEPVAAEPAIDELAKFKMSLIRGYEIQQATGMACCSYSMRVLFMKPGDDQTLYIASTKRSSSADAYKFSDISKVAVGEHKSEKIVQLSLKQGDSAFFAAPRPSTAAKWAKYLNQLCA